MMHHSFVNIVRRSFLTLSIVLCLLECRGIETYRDTLIQQIPSWVILSEMEETATVHSDMGEETISIHLKDGLLSLDSENFLYQPDAEWIVADCMIFDVDHDEKDEVLLHVWKKGSFGKYQPFWREPDNKTFYSEHLFIYEWDRNSPDRLKPIWMSSAMPIFGKYVIIQENGDILIISPDGSETLWR